MSELPADYFARLFPGEPLDVTVFAPEDLELAPQRGRTWATTWQWLAHWTSCPSVTPDKASGGGFTIAALTDGIRRKSHCSGASAIGIDCDKGDTSPEQAFDLLAKYRRIIYTTHSHTTEAPRWRGIIATSRPMTPAEYRVVAGRVRSTLAASGIALDEGAGNDPVRLWYAPAVRDFASPFQHLAELTGGALDVDRILAAERDNAAREQEARARLPQTRRDDARQDRYQRAALTKAAENVLNASVGDRHHTLCREAYSLARDELRLEPGDIADALVSAWVTAAGEGRRSEGERTIADSIRSRGRAA